MKRLFSLMMFSHRTPPLFSSCGLLFLSFFSHYLYFSFTCVFMNRLSEASSAGLGETGKEGWQMRRMREREREFSLTWRVIAVLCSELWTFSAYGNDKRAEFILLSEHLERAFLVVRLLAVSEVARDKLVQQDSSVDTVSGYLRFCGDINKGKRKVLECVKLYCNALDIKTLLKKCAVSNCCWIKLIVQTINLIST